MCYLVEPEEVCQHNIQMLVLRINMDATFDVNGKPFRVELSVWGSEKYYYDNQLLLKRRSLSTTGKVPFQIDDDLVEIDVVISTTNFEAKAYVNGNLEVAELFPELKVRIEKRKQNTQSKNLVRLIVWIVSAVLFAWIFQSLKQP